MEGLEELSRDDCLSLLGTTAVGRIGVSIGALPAILPVNFILDEDQIVIRSVAGSKLDAAIAQQVVAFQADGFSDRAAWGWSVLVRGRGSEILDEEGLTRARTLPLRAWAFPDSADRFLRIETTLVTGRRFPALSRV